MSEWRQLEVKLDNVRNAMRSRGHELEWKLNAAASKEQIANCEAAIGQTLPDSFRAFLSTYNGLSLSVDHDPRLSDDLMIFGTDKIVELHTEFQADYRDLNRDGEDVRLNDVSGQDGTFWDGLMAFAYYGDGYCLFESRPASNEGYVVLDLDIENTLQTRQHVIATTFEDWLSRLLRSAIDNADLIYWLPSLPD